ncbi:hypothetical protein G7046_g6404 [Stylonectria norvegica]|nr:hypothetical protein G7046_g6404 [Stylonectria norvegica]
MTAETTILADVAPGNETGVYYITICNLPFGTTWQELKDWIRSACAVDHIEVFDSSTSGWVRVNGRHNFEKAWALLNGGVFRGRCIIASDRNRNETIKIKEFAETSAAGSHSQAPRYRHTPPNQYVSPTSLMMSPQYSTASSNQLQYRTGVYAHPSAATYSNSIPAPSYNDHSVFAAAETGDYSNYDAGNLASLADHRMNPSAAPYAPHYEYNGSQFVLPHRGQAEHLGYPDTYMVPSAEAGNQGDQYLGEDADGFTEEYLPTEQRKVHVSPFSQQAHADEVSDWIYRKVGSQARHVNSIEVPKGNNRRYLRGHAFVIFDSAKAAGKAMDALNKAKFQDRRINARLTVEGVATSETLVPTGPRGLEDQWGATDHGSRQRDSKGLGSSSWAGTSSHAPRATASSDKKHSSSSRKSHSSEKHKGTSDKKSSSSEKKRSASDRKSSKEAGPVVVDGTSQRAVSRSARPQAYNRYKPICTCEPAAVTLAARILCSRRRLHDAAQRIRTPLSWAGLGWHGMGRADTRG